MQKFEYPNFEAKEYIVETNYGKFSFEPLERGFGTTIGNALRRVLLSSLPGAAVFSIVVHSQNVFHEFTAMDKISEDVTSIILNLKKLIIQVDDIENYDNEVFKLKIEKEGSGDVTGKDIITPENIKILNEDLHICTIEEGGLLDMDLNVRVGRGYVSADYNKSLYHSKGYGDERTIYIDSIYTPVEKVSYLVEQTRVGQSAKYDRVIFEVFTNGAISPVKAIALGSHILAKHFMLLTNVDEIDLESQANLFKNAKKEKNNAESAKSIEELNLSVRAYNCLKRDGIATVEELLEKTEDEVVKIRNLGKKSFKELVDKVHKLGLSFKQSS